ncbi:hypothetical protein EB234_30070 [Mesorhizobium japonicum R7A]|uniref:Uncharacterized protein n=1 Tax=Mesorhizobium loti R88b TaxID=935548 RepID=A0A6M7WYY6_RHILI|nr:hypothetical protein EB234_30070 [Mesorhizobium japonicum R7A]QKD05719.1 hypothetical protein EB235_33130 [Mesorhizobium loti R88b]
MFNLLLVFRRPGAGFTIADARFAALEVCATRCSISQYNVPDGAIAFLDGRRLAWWLHDVQTGTVMNSWLPRLHPMAASLLARHTGQPLRDLVKLGQILERFITDRGLRSISPATAVYPGGHYERCPLLQDAELVRDEDEGDADPLLQIDRQVQGLGLYEDVQGRAMSCEA